MAGNRRPRPRRIDFTAKLKKAPGVRKRFRNSDLYLFEKINKLETVLGINPRAYQQKSTLKISPLDLPLYLPMAVRHPFSKYIRKSDFVSSSDLNSILRDLSLAFQLYESGAIPAAVNSATDYSQHSWTRDTAIVAYCLALTNHLTESYQAISSLAVFYGRREQRDRFISFHYHENPYEKYRFGNPTLELPHIRARIDESGRMTESDQDWSHSQLDAIGMWLFVTFRLANNGLLDIKALDTEITTGINPDNELDSIFCVALKFLDRIRFWHQHDHGPWEDRLEPSRASSVGIGIAALKEAIQYFESDRAPKINFYQSEQSPPFCEQLYSALKEAGVVLEARLPRTGAYALETEAYPADSALSFLLYPFNPGLNLQQEQAILRALYKNRMGEIGFTRRDSDEYVGQDYIYRKDHPVYCDPDQPLYRAAQWTLFDPLIAAYYYNRYIRSNALDTESYAFANRHLKRSLLQITKSKDSYRKAYDGRNVSIPKGRVPEAYFFDSRRNKWRANENSPLLMAEAAFAMMIERAGEATKLWELAQK